MPTDLLLLDGSISSEDYISEIPDECLAIIFQSLSSSNRKRCSLVCRRWLIVEGQSRHRQSKKMPQWRTGPLGQKTLCNACGVRYKSGRLVPEYHPAASPTFVLTQHSNSHRKVMDLRRQKEMHDGGGGGQQQQQDVQGVRVLERIPWIS